MTIRSPPLPTTSFLLGGGLPATSSTGAPLARPARGPRPRPVSPTSSRDRSFPCAARLARGARVGADAPPRRGGRAGAPRQRHRGLPVMSQLATALADSFIIAWNGKRHWAWWRPVTALNQGSEGVPVDPRWQPALGTPPRADCPPGHTTDRSSGRSCRSAYSGIRAVRCPTAQATRARRRRGASRFSRRLRANAPRAESRPARISAPPTKRASASAPWSRSRHWRACRRWRVDALRRACCTPMDGARSK